MAGASALSGSGSRALSTEDWTKGTFLGATPGAANGADMVFGLTIGAPFAGPKDDDTGSELTFELSPTIGGMGAALGVGAVAAGVGVGGPGGVADVAGTVAFFVEETCWVTCA